MLEIGDIRQIKCRIKANDKERQDILKRCQEKKLFITLHEDWNNLENAVYIVDIKFDNDEALVSWKVINIDSLIESILLSRAGIKLIPIYINNKFSHLRGILFDKQQFLREYEDFTQKYPLLTAFMNKDNALVNEYFGGT